MCFNKDGTISTLNGRPLELIDQLTYFGSNISSTENNVNKCIGKEWTSIDSLLIIWKSISNEMIGEKARWKLYQEAACYLEQILEAAPYKTAAVRPLTTYLTNHPSKTNKTWRALLEK